MELHNDDGSHVMTGPEELECDCGHHMVIDPEKVERFMKQRTFRCADCKRRKSMRECTAIAAGPTGNIKGVCARCEIEGMS